MTLILSAVDHDDLCHGWSWTIEDEDVLAERVARVALGQYRHVARILAGANIAEPATTADHIAGATKFLTVEAGKDPWHRDGWLFQTISWIAAHQNAQGAITRPPHALPSLLRLVQAEIAYMLVEDGNAEDVGRMRRLRAVSHQSASYPALAK